MELDQFVHVEQGLLVSAISRLIDRYGAYLSHIISLTEDPTVKAADRQKLKGYCCDETYQGAKYEEGLTFLDRHKNKYAESVMSCLKDRVKMQHTSLLTDTLTLLATHGLEKFESSDFC